MKVQELDSMINQVLEEEAKKLIMEQVNDVEHLIDSIKNFQSLSGLIDKIIDISNDGSDISIDITNVTPEELVDCCGGSSLEEAQKNLMQGIHHDLEDNGFTGTYDVDVETSGDENSLNLLIRIIPNDDELSKENEMGEQAKDTNPTVDDKKDVILGGNEINNMTSNTKNMSESKKKKIITLNEDGMADLLKNIINEATKTMDPVTEKAIKDSGKENDEALKAVEKKIKDYLSFKGNDNPEFPNQIGMGDDKAARVATSDEEEFIDDNRGRGPQDLDYQDEPSDEFKKRLKMSLVGDSKMGNPSDAANAIKTDVGEKMHKNVEKRQKIHKKEPIYAKEPVPVDTKKSEDLRPVNEEIERMKRMASYNEKTQ